MRWVAALTICLVAATARAEDWGARRDPFDPGVVRRYKTILTRDPHDASALPQLIALYKRFRTVAKLEGEYKVQLDAAPADWATLVVVARFPRADRAATLALWTRALAAKPDDARGWLAFGELAIDPRAARAAFRKAVEHAKSPRDKRLALTKLIGAGRSANDPATVDAAYVDLIAMSPKDGQLWLDRGNAQIAAGWYVPALETFAKAESLLAGDPERRLTAAMTRGVALERVARVDDAIEVWENTLDKTPRGSYLRREIVPRIIEAERKRRRLGFAITRLQKRWPERTRGHYEWEILGDLWAETGDEEMALVFYRHAVAKAPTEVETQRKLIKLLDKLRPSEALAQHEAIAKLAPGEANLQIELAKRYRLTDPAKAQATLDRLTKRMAKHVGVRIALSELYTQWDDPVRVLVELEAIANLEPTDPDHAVVLGNAHWRAGNSFKAIEAWNRLDKIKDAATQLRLGDIFTLHNLWTDAEAAYTRALAQDSTNPEAWRGRARARDELGNHATAVADAKRAVALIGVAGAKDGFGVRYQLMRALGHWTRNTPAQPLPAELTRWRFAFARGDVAAGYLLVAHHARIQSDHQHEVMLELYRLVPDDDALGINIARSFSKKKDFDRARAELVKIGRRSPARTDEINHLLHQLETDRARAVEETIADEEGIEPTKENLIRRRRLGFRIGIGSDVAGPSSALVGFGLYHARHFGDRRQRTGASLVYRLDWSQRDDEGDHMEAIGIGLGFTGRIFKARRFDLGLGAGARVELRYGGNAEESAWGRGGLAGDVTLELLPRRLPATLGVRFQQAITDPVRASTLVFEMGFEVR